MLSSQGIGLWAFGTICLLKQEDQRAKIHFEETLQFLKTDSIWICLLFCSLATDYQCPTDTDKNAFHKNEPHCQCVKAVSAQPFVVFAIINFILVKFAKKQASAPSANDDVLHSSSKRREREKDSFNLRSEVCTAAVVADLPRVRGEAETIVRLGLN